MALSTDKQSVLRMALIIIFMHFSPSSDTE